MNNPFNPENGYKVLSSYKEFIVKRYSKYMYKLIKLLINPDIEKR
jgi:hypothetical protein